MNEIKTGEIFDLKEMIHIKPYQILSRRLLFSQVPEFADTTPEWVLYAMDKQETISSETSPHTKFIFVLEGELCLEINKGAQNLSAGASILVPSGTWHGFTAGSDCKFLIIRI